LFGFCCFCFREVALATALAAWRFHE
jgi:hypothetical protein